MSGPQDVSPAFQARSSFGWPPAFRLRRSDDIGLVQRTGRRLGGPWLTVWVLPNGLGHARFALAVSRKVGGAVVRNRVKRRLRDVFRHVRPELGPVDVVVSVRPVAADLSRDALDGAVRGALAPWRVSA